MTQTYRIRHRTRYAYDRPVSVARCNVRLLPIAWPDQHILSHNLSVEPSAELQTAQARAGLVNLTRLTLLQETNWLNIVSTAEMRVERPVPKPQPGDPGVGVVADLARESIDLSDTSPANFLYPSPNIPAGRDIAAYAASSLHRDRPVVEAVAELNWRIWQDFRYDSDATNAATLPAEAFAANAGVCQDFAQIMICGLRAMGLPSAYASGYIRTIPPPGETRLLGADAMHGWVLVWCGPERGWIGFDPTNGIFMAEDHVLVAVGRDYLDIAPVDGIFTGYGAQDVRVEVDMEPIIL